MEGLNGPYGQPSNGLKIDRQQSKKVIFYRQRSKMQVKAFRESQESGPPYQTWSLFETEMLTSTGWFF